MAPLEASQRRFLKELFPGDAFTDAPEDVCIYGTDASRKFEPAWGVVRPQSEEQVVRLMAWANEQRVPLFTRARGTNVVGACVPSGGGLALSMLRMNRVLAIDSNDFVAVVQPGVVTADLQRELDGRGLMYPPDPASVRISTIGGNVATCAGGMRAVKYGVTRDFVLGIRAVLPGGEIIDTGGRNHKNVVGLDLVRLLVGSEGTLGVFTELTLKLLPKPESTASVLAGFEDQQQALDAARAVFAAGLLPAAMEFMAEEVLRAVEQVGDVPWPRTAKAALLLRLDGPAGGVGADMESLAAVLKQFSPSSLAKGQGADEEALWEPRRLINPASFKIAPDKMSDDIAVPRGEVGRALAGIRVVAKDVGLTILTFGHLGDGNIHVNIMYDAKAGQLNTAAGAKERILELVLSLGGTMSGEHGVGLSKLPYLERQLSEREVALMRHIKAGFDPKGIMNPGKAY